MHKLQNHRAHPSIGLVLSGGGAKGAYQVGVLKALNTLGITIDILAGASIGSLNGAIVAAASNQQEAAQNLEALWLELAQISPIEFGSMKKKIPAYLVLLGSFGLPSPIMNAAVTGLGTASSLLSLAGGKKVLEHLNASANMFSISDDGLLCNQRITQLIGRFLPETGLSPHIPLHVSVYPTQGIQKDFLRIIGSMLSIGDTADSEFIHIQALPGAEQKKLLLASAALPLLYAPQEINGQLYSDGGQGGWSSIQGNTPIAPLLKAGCKHVLVTHLSDGSLWDRSRFPNASIIEIRPKTSAIARKGAVGDLLGFDNEKIPSWIQQGHDDTMACVEPILNTLKIFGELHHSERTLQDSLKFTGEDALRTAMKELDS